jgi:hypothetical protein
MCLEHTNPCVDADFTFGVLRELWQLIEELMQKIHTLMDK